MSFRSSAAALCLACLICCGAACDQHDDNEAAGDTDDTADDDDDQADDDDDDGVYFAEQDVFVNVQDGYPVFRIPAIIETMQGSLLAFCEGRFGISDTGDIDIVMKRSLDSGRTWSTLQVVVDNGADTAGNPAPVVDRETGAILLPFCTNPAGDQDSRRVWITRSTDDGLSWSAPVEITDMTLADGWSWYATGPGRSIQLDSGRFVVPCDHREEATGAAYSHVIYSDDGAAWHIGGSIGPDADESQVAQLEDGSLLLNMRDLSDRHRRRISRSYDQGLSWTAPAYDEALPDPSCMGSLLQTPYGLLFSNPESEVYLLRQKLTVRLSLDNGATWAISKVLHPGGAAYSALALLPDGNLGCLYENGALPFLPYDRITLAAFSLAWLKQ